MRYPLRPTKPLDSPVGHPPQPPKECRATRRWRRRTSDPTLHRLVGELIAARVRAGLTQEQIAYKLGTQKSAISRLESGLSHRPTLTTIENYALVVGCRVQIRLQPLP